MTRSSPLAKNFCHCIKKVRKTVKVRSRKNKSLKSREKAAIGICVKSILQSRGKTLRKFKCRPTPYLLAQYRRN